MNNDEKLLARICIDPQIMMGKPTIKGTRITVQYIIGLLAQNMSAQEIMHEYKNITQEDILACLLFARKALDNSMFFPLEHTNR